MSMIATKYLNKLALLSIISTSSYAGIQNDLQKAFDAMDFNANVSSAYNAQSAGHYSGGSIYARSAIRNQQMAYVNLPKVSAGCGGIDMYAGGFSFITANEAKTLAKNIMSDSVSYGFQLALETVSPLISNTMKDLSRKITDFTNRSINSCEAAVGLVGSVFPKTDEAQRNVCQSVSNTDKGLFADYAKARMECNNTDGRTKAFDRLKNEPGYENQLLGSMNFAWKAIKSNPLFKDDNDLAELMMSLSGTVIYNEAGNAHKGTNKQHYPSLAVNNDFLNTLMHGGDLKVYDCAGSYEENGCLNPAKEKKKIVISKDKAFVSMVSTRLNSIADKIRETRQKRQRLTDAELKFIQSTSLPVYKMLNVQSAFSKGISTLDVTTYSEVIATDMLYVYLEESLQEILSKAKTLQLPEAEYKEFISSIEAAKQNVRNRKLDSFEQRTLTTQMIEQTMLIEQRLAQQLQAPFQDAINWGNGI
ncbi:MAG: conjugal transfer protein TraH [Rickettsiaceae bacterium]|nr:conjugal transfer protein TraH [Rickettsiaceae bacterium]